MFVVMAKAPRLVSHRRYRVTMSIPGRPPVTQQWLTTQLVVRQPQYHSAALCDDGVRIILPQREQRAQTPKNLNAITGNCQDLASITQSELMRQVNDNSKNGECTSYRPATYTTIHVVPSLCA